MHESALFLLGLLVAESSVYHAVRSSIRCPPRPVYTCLYIYIYVHARIQHRSTRCETLHTHPGRVDTDRRERKRGMIERVRASASFYKPAKGSVTDSLGEYRWFARFLPFIPPFFPSFFLFFFLFLSLFLIPFRSVSFFRKR